MCERLRKSKVVANTCCKRGTSFVHERSAAASCSRASSIFRSIVSESAGSTMIAKAVATTPLGPPINSIAELLREPSMEGLAYINDIEAITSQPIAVLAAQIGEDRDKFLSFLIQNGVQSLSDRQLFTNTLAKMVRIGRITRGWAKPPETASTCSSCGRQPASGKKLLVCGRCKITHYCDAKCQKVHWSAGHKAKCQRPELTAAEQWAKVDDLGASASTISNQPHTRRRSSSSLVDSHSVQSSCLYRWY